MKTGGKPQCHTFTVKVVGASTKKSAELAVLSAFSQRRPDGYEFYVGGKPACRERQIDILSLGLIEASEAISKVGLGGIPYRELAEALLALNKRKGGAK